MILQNLGNVSFVIILMIMMKAKDSAFNVGNLKTKK